VLFQLLATPLQGVLNALADLLRVVTDVLLPRALKRDLGADDRDKDTHAVPLGVDLVGLPMDSAISDLSDNVVAGLGRREGKVGE